MKRIGAALLLIVAGFSFGGCASSESSASASTASDVSTIPWNRPESWEGRGPLGGMGIGTQ